MPRARTGHVDGAGFRAALSQGRPPASARHGAKQRLRSLPEVPTSAKVGLSGWEMSAWFGVFAPRGTPPEIVRFLNGLDVETDAEVDAAWRVCTQQAAKWGLHEITKPLERHGTYSFLFWDADDNAWEVLSNPKGGYTWIFEQGDLKGRGHFEKEFRAKHFRDKLPKTEKA